MAKIYSTSIIHHVKILLKTAIISLSFLIISYLIKDNYKSTITGL